MQYTRFTFKPQFSGTAYDPEIVFDLLADLLASAGFDSFVPGKEQLEAYIPHAQANKCSLGTLLAEFPLEGVSFTVTHQDEPDINWNEEWERNYFKPLVMGGGRCVIRAPFHEAHPNAEIELIISPKMAFGTGNHDTTSLIIDYLLAHNLKDLSVLDMGCGTGILGLIALKMGASSLTAIDIDEWAYRNVMENAALNGLEDVPRILCGNAAVLESLGCFDLILANITRNVLLQDMKDYVKHLNSGGTLILSGFYEEDVSPLRTEAERLGLTFVAKTSTERRWSMLEFGKSPLF